MRKMKNINIMLTVAGILGSGLEMPKPSTKDRKVDNRKNTLSRSMTEEELAYYKKHKSLVGFKSSETN